MVLSEFEGSSYEFIALHLLRQYAGEKGIRQYKFNELVDKVKKFCIERQETTIESLIKYMIKSKLLKPLNFDYEKLLQEAFEIKNKWDDLLRELFIYDK